MASQNITLVGESCGMIRVDIVITLLWIGEPLSLNQKLKQGVLPEISQRDGVAKERPRSGELGLKGNSRDHDPSISTFCRERKDGNNNRANFFEVSLNTIVP